MIIPWGTDAPIYHRPIATIGIIVVNVLAFLLFPYQDHEEWTLVLGDGLHPLQWVTNIFMHAGFFQLAGNMLFLWTFGLVVEGKLGWWAFLLVYLGLGVSESAGMQLVVRTDDPHAHAGIVGGHLRPARHVPGLGTHERGRLHHLAAIHAQCL